MTSQTRHDPAPTPSRPIPHFPGLDGLRGVAVLAVLFFHGGFSWAVGGYLGVSTFFTLSGFLITLLLLVEASRTRAVSLRAFYGRRVRRLLPASLAAIALAIVFTAVAGTTTQRHNLGGDVTSSLLDVANWHFILQRVSYADLFAAPSALLHYWSLAIEEQFYLLFPLLALFVLVRRGWSRSRFGLVLIGLMGVSLAVTLFGGFSHDRIYFGTETRSFELLAGGLLAVIIYDRRVIDHLKRPQVSTSISVAGAVSLGLCAWMWVRVPQTADWLYRGGLSAYSILTCLVIAAAILPANPVHVALSNRGLRRVGELSYAIYVFHWPIFLWIDGSRTGLHQWPLFALRMAVTVALALVSERLLELPIRRQEYRIAGRSPLLVAAPLLAVALLIGSWVVTANAAPPLIDFAQAQSTLNHLATSRPSSPATTAPAPNLPFVVGPVPTTPSNGRGPLPPARVAAFGDSTGVMVGVGLVENAGRQDLVTPVRGWAELGCGLGRGGLIRWAPANIPTSATTAECNDWADHDAAALDASHPDLALVLYGPWDVLDRQLPGDPVWRSFGDPVYDAFMHHEMLDLVDLLSSRGAVVVWLTSPPVRNLPQRVDLMNAMIKQLPSERPGKVVVLDLAAYLAATGHDAQLRPDGIHLSYPGTAQVAQDWLIPQLSRVWREHLSARPAKTHN